jgi:O-methyltransferase
MSNRTLTLTAPLYEYLTSVSVREPALLRRLRQETARDTSANMQIGPEQGQFMGLLVELTGARNIIEIGTYTGYSSLCMALAMPGDDGRLICCDISEAWTAIAKRYWVEAGVDDRIHLHLAPALDTLRTLLRQGEAGRFDLIFIDADKENYLNYYESALELLRPGGLIMVDNTLWNGAVIDEHDQSEATQAIRRFNQVLYDDDRVSLSMVPIGDGLTLALKK